MRATLTVLAVAGLAVLLPSDGRTQGDSVAPFLSPAEVQQALQEHRDALATLKTAQRALEASERRLDALLRRALVQTPVPDSPPLPPVPQRNPGPPTSFSPSPIPTAEPGLPPPAGATQPPVDLTPRVANLPPQNLPVPSLADADTAQALRRVLERLERIEARLDQMETAPKKK
jgi:hypothetical protein